MFDDTPISPSDAILARGYAAAIKPLLGISGPVGKNQLILTSPPTQLGIAAGSDVDPRYTNYQIYNLADTLQDSDNPVLGDSDAGSYVDQLQSYLNYIILDGCPSEENIKWLKDAADKFAATSKESRAIAKEALAEWKAIQPGIDFEEWAQVHYPSLQSARERTQIAEFNLQQAEQAIHGADAPRLALFRNHLSNALNQHGSVPGYNQQAMPQRDQPTDLAYVPLYTIENYINTVENWRTITKGIPPDQIIRDQIIKIDIDRGQQTKWEDYGFKKIRGGGNGVRPLIYAEINTNGTKERRNLDTEGLESKIELTLAMVGSEKFNIRAGLWNASDVKTVFPKLRPDAPKNVLGHKFARVTSVLAGYDIQLKATFETELIEPMDKIHEEVKGKGGTLHIFGVSVTVLPGGGSRERNGYSFEGIEWDKSAGSLILTPSTGQLAPSFLGALAERFE